MEEHRDSGARVIKNSISMNGGEGPNSYSKNSKFQKQATEQAKVFISETIVEKLELQEDSKVFSIADFGCSVGPNAYSSVDNIIQAVLTKYITEKPELQMPEFHVFFNDHIANDFNTLFRTLPPGRQYMAAGVPGSFQGRLFPKSSINLMHSSFALHWLSRVPAEVTEQDSSSWNNGRISYPLSSNQVIEAFRAQFFSDMKAFLEARSAELDPGGLLMILIPGRHDQTDPSESVAACVLECLSDALADMVKQGLTREDLLDSFNLPIFFPSAAEVTDVVLRNTHLKIERVEEICHEVDVASSPGFVQLCKQSTRAALEGILSEHFGPNLIDELFDRFTEKVKNFLCHPRSTLPEKSDTLLLLVLRNDVA